MLSLIDYSDSEDEDSVPLKTLDNQQISKVSSNLDSNKADQFFNLETNSDDSEDDDDDDHNIEVFQGAHGSSISKNQKTKTELSNPFRMGTSNDISKSDSVFQIPFLEQEMEKSASLERHVKMTATARTQEMINGKKICWNYRKGKCRFGASCTFAHDSDIQQAIDKTKESVPSLSNVGNDIVEKEKESLEYDESSVVISSDHLSTKSGQQSSTISNEFSPERTHTNTTNIGKKGKKRVGLSNSLNPPKKSLKMYQKFNP